MKVEVLTGSKEEIATRLARIEGEVREAIVFIEEPASPVPASLASEDIFAEMDAYTVSVGDAEYGREHIYTQAEGE